MEILNRTKKTKKKMKSRKNPFADNKTIRTIDYYRISYLLVAGFMFLFTEVGRFIYRPYIYKNSIDDFGIADSIGNLGGIIVQIFFMLAIANSQKKKGFNLIAFAVLGFVIYEFAQPYLPKGVFDWKDVYGTLIGGIISTILLILIKIFLKNKVIYIFK